MTVAPPLQSPLNQVALSVIDLKRSEQWFREGLGFVLAGGSRLMMSGPLAAPVQGLPGAASTGCWLVGRNPWFLLELFQFCRPVAQLMPDDARPCDTGYRRIGAWVADFDAALSRLAALGTRPLSVVMGERGERRACVRNPDGVFVEIMEKDPLPQAPGRERAGCDVALRSVTLATPDLAASMATLRVLSAKEASPLVLHDSAHEALWGLAGARTRSAVFERGDVPVEAVQYLDPSGRPWAPGYRISDQGILNIAFGARSRQEQRQLFDRALTLGARPNHRPIDLPGVGVVYVNDAQGFSVELLRMAPWADKHWGFVPRPLQQRPQPDNQRVEASVPIDAVWAVLNEQGRMGDWIGFPQVSVQREGFAQRNGRGSERFMKEPLGTVREQVTGVEAKSRIRYRVIDGSPVVYRQGEIDVAASGRGTRATWSIRFRCKVPLFGGLLPATLRRVLANMLVKGLKAHVEGAGRPALQTA